MEYSKKALPGLEKIAEPAADYTIKAKTSSGKKKKGYEPPNLGKAIKLQVPDFNDPDRPKTCLEVDFPIAPINALSNLEGNAGKPIYQMSKWWARRRSSVFRSLLIAAATQAPEDETQAAKLVWDAYYANHQKAGNFSDLRVLEPFMGGGTTLVEGARLGFQLTGIDLNPVAWFVTKNELAGTDPEEVRAFFDHIEAEVKPLVQPFYTTICPRGHEGRWIDVETNDVVDVDPLGLAPEERKRYRWEGPEVIYTFWAKHGPCPAPGCGHRTPIFKDQVIAVKNLTTYMIPLQCPSCQHKFQAELGETRMAPGVERVVLESEPSFTEMSQPFAQLLNDYNKGRADDKRERIEQLLEMVDDEQGLCCPECSTFAGGKVKQELTKQSKARRASDINKNKFGIKRYRVNMHLLMHPDWLSGTPGLDENEDELGGYAGASPDSTAAWFRFRHKKLKHIEVRGQTLPTTLELHDGTLFQTNSGNVPEQSVFECSSCGRRSDIAEAERTAKHHSPVAVYALQCYCPQCNSLGFNYGGRFFKELDNHGLYQIIQSEEEWHARKNTDLSGYWPTSELPFAWETHIQKGNLTKRGYTHWWTLFNPRQLLVHCQLLKAIIHADSQIWKLDIQEQALGALQQYLRNQNMFAFWNQIADKLEPMFSNPNYHVKQQVVENSVFSALGRGNWQSSSSKIVTGLSWTKEPWELLVLDQEATSKSEKVNPNDPVRSTTSIFCGSSTDLDTFSIEENFDLVITDPPFGGNLFYADLADFFYVWLRIPLLKWLVSTGEAKYFDPPFTIKSLQAIHDAAQHPDDREDWEKFRLIQKEHLELTREFSGNQNLQINDTNPLYRPEPASDFYQQTLSACWAEANRKLKSGGLMAFTFHHNEDEAWIDVLEALFNAGFILTATYPIRSDEVKGDAANSAFGAKLIEYDIIHVCRKRLVAPIPVSWSSMRRWVKKEAQRLKEMLEISHGQNLLEPDMLVILRGKALEYYSRHYGQVYTGDDDLLGVRDALLGINQLLEDVITGETENGHNRPPDAAEPATRFYLRLFQKEVEMEHGELHKTLRGTGITSDDLETWGWINIIGTTVQPIPIKNRYAYFTAPGRNRKVLKTDLDQAHFLIGAALPGSGMDITQELNRNTFALKKSVDAILEWYAQTATTEKIRQAATLANNLVTHWRTQPQAQPVPQQMSLFQRLEAEE
ncbi:MAG: DUF1156 domain-containing protein [Anaerolineae bacterium]|nr:DUF1156 domain-containing protein [Anaerolineae bacterium]